MVGTGISIQSSRGAAQHIDRPAAGPEGIAASVAFHRLVLELHQKLVLGAVTRGPLTNSTFVPAWANSSICSAWQANLRPTLPRCGSVSSSFATSSAPSPVAAAPRAGSRPR
jgi:hypothetical protein